MTSESTTCIVLRSQQFENQSAILDGTWQAPYNFYFIFIFSSFHSYLTRRSNDLHLPRVRTNWGKQTFIFQPSKDWNNLDNDIKNCKTLSLFKAKPKVCE